MMSRRSTIVSALFLVPVLTCIILGGYALWTTGLFRWLWWAAPACWALALCLARLWQLGQKSTRQLDVPTPSHWTPNDQRAAEIVRAHQRTVEQLTPAQLMDWHVYLAEAESLALALARHYHPQASDPWSSVHVTELLAAIRLAIDDLEPWILNSLPGSHLLTIERGLKLQSVPKWWRRLSNTWLAASILWNPANILRGLTVRVAGDSAMGAVQTELLASFYCRFLFVIGSYLIEMNSGRLRGGADAYRRTFSMAIGGLPDRSKRRPATEWIAAQPLTIALVGQVSAGKSSLVNALTGSHQAAVDILPETRQVQRYQMPLGSPSVTVTLLDTPGYGESGATADQLRQIRSAMQEASAVLFVMDAHSPAREADRRTMHDLGEWYAAQPRLKPPPMLGVLTHVDLLRPALEWSPPYDWREAKGPKGQSIHDAVAYVQELFGASLAAVVPVCADVQRKRDWGILEEVLPALTLILDDAQSAALLRMFERELDRDRLKRLLKQIRRGGSDLLRCWIDERLSADRGESPSEKVAGEPSRPVKP